MGYLFLSYSHKDKSEMKLLRQRLEREDYEVWTDEWLKPGTPVWQREIKKCIKATTYLVAICMSVLMKNERFL